MPEPTDNQTEGTDTPANVDVSGSQSPGVGPTYDKALVYDNDGKPWREKFHGIAGRIQQVEKDYEEKLNERKSALDKLQAEMEARESKIEELTGKLTNAGEQLGQLQALQDRVPELEQQARQAAKLRAVLEYPELVNRQVKDMIEVDGEEHEVVTNPILDLIENVNLEDDELRKHLRRLNEIVKANEPLPEKEEPQQSMEGASPAPGEPMDESPEYWEQKARQALQEANATADQKQRDELMEQMSEYSQKAREARAELQS